MVSLGAAGPSWAPRGGMRTGRAGGTEPLPPHPGTSPLHRQPSAPAAWTHPDTDTEIDTETDTETDTGTSRSPSRPSPLRPARRRLRRKKLPMEEAMVVPSRSRCGPGPARRGGLGFRPPRFRFPGGGGTIRGGEEEERGTGQHLAPPGRGRLVRGEGARPGNE